MTVSREIIGQFIDATVIDTTFADKLLLLYPDLRVSTWLGESILRLLAIEIKIKWSDGTEKTCYSPSLVVKEYFTPGTEYELEEFVKKSRTALNIASDRVKKAYGFPCGRALGQLQQIETKALEYKDLPEAKVLFIEFLTSSS